MSRALIFASAMGCAVWFAGHAAAAPITFNTALPVGQGEIIFRELNAFVKASDDPSGAGRKMTVVTANWVLGYGLTPDLALFGVLPLTFRDLETPAGTRDASGIGDARLFARYTVYRKDAVGRTYRIAPFLGLKIPTGENMRSDASGPLPAPVQPGTGSWDVFGGLVGTYASLDWNLDLQASYRINSAADGREMGDVVRGDASFQYRLLPRSITGQTRGFLYGVLEANLIHQGRARIEGLKNPNSGGTVLNLVPGLQYATLRWIAEVAVQLPVVQNLNGSALERDFTVLAGIRVNF